VCRPADAALQGVTTDHGTSGAPTREAIALVVANVDRCSDCRSARPAGGRAAGLTTAIRNGSSAELAALLILVRESTGDVGQVDDATWC
jgi:AhpD family alkylhydroperoxidase